VLVTSLACVLGPAYAAAPILPPGSVLVVRSSANLHEALAAQPSLRFSSTQPRGSTVIHVNDHRHFQRITGFGAAMTDTSAWLIQARLTGAARTALYDDLWGPTGADMSFLRIPMGATDFTVHGRPYSYDDMPRGQSDPHLRHFSIAHDEAYVIPAIREALARNPRLAMLANPWSVPGWMKANDALDNRHHTGDLRHGALGPFAQYFVKFLQAYGAAGIRIAAITPQNEPGNATQYPGMELPADREARLIASWLRPALTAAGLHPKLYGNDQGWSQDGTAYTHTLGTGAQRRAISGIAWHCYFGSPVVMGTQHGATPQWDEIVDECAPGIIPFPVSEVMISSVREWASSVTLFNIAEDTHGGPAQPPNHGCPGCEPLATVNAQTNSYELSRSYFELAQMSRFVRPGAVRIGSEDFVTYSYTRPGVNFYGAGLDDVALHNPDGSIVLVTYNNSRAPITFTVDWKGKYFRYTLPSRSTATFLWNAKL
jgi:glucosylceramidase